jgi:hypothetical protein
VKIPTGLFQLTVYPPADVPKTLKVSLSPLSAGTGDWLVPMERVLVENPSSST